MAIFKPKTSNGSASDYFGICQFGLLNFKDRSAEFEWADIFIEASIKQKDNDFERVLQIKGTLDKEGGEITGGSVLKRMYQFFDEIGCTAGINVKGEWETPDGDKIEDIGQYLNDNHLSAVIPGTDPEFNYLGYFYQEVPKVPGGKSYTRCWNKIYKNVDDNKAKLEKDVQWMKSKGYIKEVDITTQKTEMSGSGLANL